MQEQREEDAAFYEMVHRMVQGGDLPADQMTPGSERRTQKRLPFGALQLIAPFDGRRLPKQDTFRHVQFYDISTHGFCYIDAPKPTYKYLIALFGNLPFTCLAARAVHIGEFQRPGEYKVGCQIIRRIQT